MRIGILGAGFMGGTHARAYAKIPGVEVAAVSSRHLDKAEKLAGEVGGAGDDRRSHDHRGPDDRCDQQHAADAPPPGIDDRGARRPASTSSSKSRSR